MFAHPEPVTVHSPATSTDPYSGESAPDWKLEPTDRAEACAVAPGGSLDPLANGRDPVDVDFDLLFDHDPEVSSRDRVTVRGHVCEVVGIPARWVNPFTGWQAGWVVQAKVREG